MDNDLTSDDGISIPSLILNNKMITNKTIVLYGPSRSGKTVITKHILDLLHNSVDQVVLVSPTEPSNQSFVNYVPRPLIHYSMTIVDPKDSRKRLDGAAGALGFLNKLWLRQEMLTQCYMRANEYKTLKRLFTRISKTSQSQARKEIQPYDAAKSKVELKLEKKFRNDLSCLDDEKRKLNVKFDAIKCKIYKKYIWDEIESLYKNKKTLSDDEYCAIKYIALNPKMVLIFDDCAAELKPLFSKPIFRKLFYQNRHINLTVIFTLQDDTDLPTNLRKNAFISMFCNEVVCGSNFERVANKYPKAAKDIVKSISPTIYRNKYTVLAYIRDDPDGNEFYSFKAPGLKNKMFGSNAVIEICNALASDSSKVDRSNPFYNQFH